MSDLEMTMLCSEAMGLGSQYPAADWRRPGALTLEGEIYDPLNDDAQAMALVRKFNLFVGPPYHKDKFPMWEVETSVDDEHAVRGNNVDLNRAIVECVAQWHKRAAAAAPLQKEEKK